MKMHKSSSNKQLFLLLSVLFLFINSCNSQQKSNSIASIKSGALTFEINELLHTKFTSSIPNTKPILNGFQASEKLIIDHVKINDFKFEVITNKKLNGSIPGEQWTIQGVHNENGIHISKTLILKTFKDFPNLISTQVNYTNESDDNFFINEWSNNTYSIESQGDEPLFWAFQGSSSQNRSDWINPLTPGYYKKNYMGMNDTDYGGGIPVTSVWRPDINIAVGHLTLTPKMVSLPTEIPPKRKNAHISVTENFKERSYFNSGDTIKTLETFISISTGDYFKNLKKYSSLMQAKGIKIAEPEPTAFESIWCAWGYERKFTLDEIIGTLPKVKELGIKWVVLDDGFQIAEGDWNASPTKFPKGDIEIKNLVDNIHKEGLKAKLWWTPLAADPHSKSLKENPNMRVFLRDEAPQFITWWDAYYLSPTKKETIKHTKETIHLFMDKWGFDGLKMDGQHMNAVAADHSLDNPKDSFEQLPVFFNMIYNEAKSIKPNAVIENCPCGTCMSYFNMTSMNQAVSSDPTSSWQIRHKGKTYKALIPKTAYYGDHVELSDNGNDFASSFGIGAVLGTKFTWPKDNPFAGASYLLTPSKEKIWKKWFSLYDEKMLSKEEYLGDLYDIGYDKPETHVIKKGTIIHYAFYHKNWKGKISLKGLTQGVSYKIKDYFNEIDLGKVSSTNPTIEVKFKDFLLIEALPVE